jgi:hypothetical protein
MVLEGRTGIIFGVNRMKPLSQLFVGMCLDAQSLLDGENFKEEREFLAVALGNRGGEKSLVF